MSTKLSKDLAGVQTLVGQLQQQAGDGEIDASTLDQLGEAINVAVTQNGDVHDEAQDQAVAAGAQPAPAAPKPEIPQPPAEDVQKAAAARPPHTTQLITGSWMNDVDRTLGDFTKALEQGSLRKAQDIVGRSQPIFDESFNKACHAVLNEEGFTSANMRKLHTGAPNDLEKSITASTIPGVNLMRLARLMMPVYAGLRRRFPSNPPGAGSDKSTWRVMQGFNSLSWSNLMSVAEAAIGDAVTETFTTFEATYRDLALNDSVSVKAMAASRGYDDPLQVAVIRILTAILRGEEQKLLGDNAAAIAKPGTITAAGVGSGTYGNSDDKFVVTALTYRGSVAGSTGGTSAVGETDGTSSGAVALNASASVLLTWDAVPGAVAYNVYYDAHGTGTTNIKYMATVKVNRFASSAALPSTGNNPPASNVSANANGWEGLISWCELATVYSQTITNRVAVTDNAGATLTAGTSGISQFDTILANLWTQWQIAPSCMVMSPLMAGAVTDKLLALNSGSMYRIEVSQERGTMQGGAFVSGYVNKFAPFADGTPRYLDIIPHPYMTDGTILFLSETIPYPMSREARGFAVETLVPYTYFPLAASTVVYPFAITASEVLQCFHPSAQTALMGVALS